MSRHHWRRPVPQPEGTPFGAKGPLWASGAHTGLDFPAPTGQVVRAVTPGRVLYAGDTGGAYGIQVKQTAGPGLQVWYCHLSAVAVTAGQQLAAGDPIGKVGATGNVTGPHLHLEVRRAGLPVDPAPYLSGKVATGAPYAGPNVADTPAEPASLTGPGLGSTALTVAAVLGGFGLVAVGLYATARPTIEAAEQKAKTAAKTAAEVAAL